MSALSTPGGGGTTAQSKPTSGKQKYQKLDINSLYCANRNENSEPSSVKSQLSRKHGMQSLGKVPSARRPPANLPSLKTETGQDSNANSVSTVTTTVSAPVTCISQTTTTTPNSNVAAGAGAGGWVPLPPPTSPHFRTEFPSLEAAAQPSHRSSDHNAAQPQLRPQTEGSWTCGGTAGVRPETTSSPVAAPASTPASQQTPAYRAILPSFLMKGSNGAGLGLGTLTTLRDNRSNTGASNNSNSNMANQRQGPRQPVTPRAVEVLTARPILREEQISSLDDISRDAGWAQHDDIDYDQKLDFSDGESSTPATKVVKNNNRTSIETERVETKIQEPGDEDQLWAERRQKQNNEVAQVVARARQRKEEEQRRQMRDAPAPSSQKDRSERVDRDRNDNRERDVENRDKDRNRDRDHDRDSEKERNDARDRNSRDKDRVDNRERDHVDNRDRFENRDRERDRDRDRDRDRPSDNRDRGRIDNRDRQDGDKDREIRDRDRNDRERMDRDRFREKDRNERDRDRDRQDRDRLDRDRDFRERDRDYGRDRERDRDQSNPAFSKPFNANLPPRFLRQQQNRQQEEQHKGWAFTGNKQAPRRQEPPTYNAPRHAPHNGRRSYSRDYSDREDDVRRDKEASGPQWRSEMQDYERSGRELDRSNSKDSYKELNDYKDRRNDNERKPLDNTGIDPSSRTAADKLTEVFERKSIGLTEPFASTDAISHVQTSERRITPPSNIMQSDTFEKDFGKSSWAEVAQEEQYANTQPLLEKEASPRRNEFDSKEVVQSEVIDPLSSTIAPVFTIPQNTPSNLNSNNLTTQTHPSIYSNSHIQNNMNNVTSHQSHTQNISTSTIPTNHSLATEITDIQPNVLPNNSTKSISSNENLSNVQPNLKQQTSEVMQQNKQYASQKSELSETESLASKSSTDPVIIGGHIASSMDNTNNVEMQRRVSEDIRNERFSNEQLNKMSVKDPIERKSSGSSSEKKGRPYNSGGYNMYVRGWGARDTRGRRSHRLSRSNNRASESDGSTDGANIERKERRKAPRSPRGGKKQDRPEDINQPSLESGSHQADGLENREPFAPRGQPSRRGRGGFQGTTRPPAPAKRVTGYGPPNTKSPFSQANRAVKDSDDMKDNQEDREKANKSRASSSNRKGRDRRSKAAGGPLSGEDENWETTSEHSEGGGVTGRRRSGGRQSVQSQKGQHGARNQNLNRQNNSRNQMATKKDGLGDNKTSEMTEGFNDLKITTNKKDEEIVDDGFQEVRNKKNSKDTRGTPSTVKEEKQPRSRSNQGGGRNGSSTRSGNDKSNTRGSAPVSGKSNAQYERPRQANLPPRFVKQRQKQQMGLSGSFGPETGTAPPPPSVNAWDKPISQSLRGNIEEPTEVVVDAKSSQSSHRSSPGDNVEPKAVVTPSPLMPDKTGVLDGATPPVETIIFENTNYKTAPPAEALKQKYQPNPAASKPQGEEVSTEIESRSLSFNGDVRSRPRSIQELMIKADAGRPVPEADGSLGIQMSFDTSQKPEDSSDIKLDFAFDSDLGQLTEDKTSKSLGLPRGTHMSTSNTISPLAADLNLKIASVKKVWEMPAVAEGSEELQFAGFEENNTETGAPPNVCKVKPTQQLQSPPPQHYNHVSYQGGYGGLSVPSPPAVLFNSSQQILGSSQQLQQQGGLYGAFLDQTRGQFGGFPGNPYGAGSATPYNYQPPPDMFQSLPSQYRMAAAAGGGAAFGQSGQLGNSPSTVLISSTSNSLMSATVKPSTQQIGAIGSKGGGVGGVGAVGGVNTFQQQFLGYSAPVGDASYSLPGLLPRPAPPASSYYSPYQPPTAPAPTYPMQFTQQAQSNAFSSPFLSSQIHVAAAVQQMQQQYRAPPLQQQYAPPQPRPPPQLKSPLHEHANGFAQLCESASPTPKGAKQQKPPHSPPQHKYHAVHQHPQHPPPAHTPHQHHAHQQHQQHQHQQHQQHQHQQHQQHQQIVGGGNNGRGGGNNGNAMNRGGMVAPRYPAPIQRPHAPALPMYRAPPAPAPRPHHAPRHNLYYHHHQRNGTSNSERTNEGSEVPTSVEDATDSAVVSEAPPVAEVKAE